MRRIKRGHATAVIALLIAVLFVMQAIDYRDALRCYVSQQAEKYQQAQGFATADEIHDIVWESTVDDLDGQLWRARLDYLFHDIFMGGSRGLQVMAQMQNPADDLSDVYCGGSIEWYIWDIRDDTTLETPLGIEEVHEITMALQTIPPEELWHYEVSAVGVSFQAIWSDEGNTWIQHRSPLGEVSAKDWLRGAIAPSAWAGWYARWLELQEPEGE